MKLLIELVIVVIILYPAQAYDIYNNVEPGVGHNAFTYNPINRSPSSSFYWIRDLGKSEVTIAKNSWFSKNSGIFFVNHPYNFNYSDRHSAAQANIFLNLENSSNLSIWSETSYIKMSDKLKQGAMNFSREYGDINSNSLEALNVKIYQPIYKSAGNNLIYGPFLNSTISLLNKTGQSIHTNQKNNSRFVVHAGESIQAIINTAHSGDIIEVNSGTYNESLHINKTLTIQGIDVGGGLPIVDANGNGSAIEISADQVILEKIISTNSSKSSMKPGAGVRFSSSNNCSIRGLATYNNYYGVELKDSNNNNISESNISNSTYGIRIYYSNNNTLEQNSIIKTRYPLDIISSKGNLIQKNIFRNNSGKVETIKGNKFIDNNETFTENNKSKEGIIRNTGPETSQSYSGRESVSSQSSDTSGDGESWIPQVTPIDQGRNYRNLAQKAAGTLVFNPPKVMTRDVGEWIDARIGLNNTTQLVRGLLGKGDVQFRDVNVAMNMTYVVKLESDSGFEISAKRPEAQVLGTDPAVWLWQVTPTEAGNHTLILSVDLQLEKPPYNCKCENVTYWPVSVKVLEPSSQQQVMNIMNTSYSMIGGLIAFLAGLFSLILLFRQLRKGKD